MSLFVLDTDHVTRYYRGDPIVVRRVDSVPASDFAISVSTVDEQLTGWYTVGRRARRPDEIPGKIRSRSFSELAPTDYQSRGSTAGRDIE
jgi:hypothetical protein